VRRSLQLTVSDFSSDSDSDIDNDDYETINLECQACVPQSFGHVVCDDNKSDFSYMAESTSGFSNKVQMNTKSSIGWRATESLTANEQKNRVVVIWKSYNQEQQEEPEPEVRQENDHVTQSVSLLLPCLEEVHALFSCSCLPDLFMITS